MRKEKEQKKPFYALYLVLAILAIVSVMTIISFVDPALLIGWYLDADVRNQLNEVHQSKFFNSSDPTSIEDIVVNARFTFDNDELVEIRVSRSIDVFNQMFDGFERNSTITKKADVTELVLSWSFNPS
jgi:hypothetical protein